MAYVADRVKETSITTGTGTLNLDGAVSKFISFVAGIGTGNQCYYAIVHQTAAEWEVGIGAVTDATPDTLSRTTVLASSNAGALVNFSAGTKDVFATYPAGRAVFLDVANVFTANQTISSTAPLLILTDTTASAKSLTVAVDANLAQLRESAGASGSLLVLDLANARVGIGTTGPTSPLHIFSPIVPQVFIEGNSTNLAALEIKNANSAILWDVGVEGGAYHPAGSFSISVSGVGPAINISTTRQVGIGMEPTYQLQLSTDSAGKPGAGGLWTVVSDEHIKKDIELADLDRCYEIVKSVRLKRFGWADGVYTEGEVKDRKNLGWIAQDVQAVFPKSTNTVPFIKRFIKEGKKEEVSEACLDLDGGQMMMAMYGTVQKLMDMVEELRDGTRIN